MTTNKGATMNTAETYADNSCCDGTGWTGNEYERCTEHYEPLDAIWFS